MQQTSTARWTITQILLFDFPRVSQTVDRRWRNGKEKKKKKEKEMFFTERKMFRSRRQERKIEWHLYVG